MINALLVSLSFCQKVHQQKLVIVQCWPSPRHGMGVSPGASRVKLPILVLVVGVLLMHAIVQHTVGIRHFDLRAESWCWEIVHPEQLLEKVFHTSCYWVEGTGDVTPRKNLNVIAVWKVKGRASYMA